MESHLQEQSRLFGFFALHETQDQGAYVGAILVTDERGVPQEFRCTYAVKPSAVQRTLYGSALVPYIGVALCGSPLLKELRLKPQFVIVQDEDFLDIRSEWQAPLVAVRRAGESLEIQSSAGASANAADRLECPGGRFQPIIITSHPGFPDDADDTRNALEAVFDSFDPVEPFDRIASAVAVLANQDERFR